MSVQTIAEDIENRRKYLESLVNSNIEEQKKYFARLLDATILKQDASANDIIKLCKSAFNTHCRTVCIQPIFIKLVHQTLNELSNKNQIGICTVANFPLGMGTTQNLIQCIEESIEAGADEIDFVQNISWLKDKNYKKLERQSEQVFKSADRRTTKVILETSLLTEEEIEISTSIHANAGIEMIKTSTGFGKRGASIQDIITIDRILNESNQKNGVVGIKASGGIRNTLEAQNFIKSGATRLGASSADLLIDGHNRSQTGQN